MDRSSSSGGLGPRHDASSRVSKPASTNDKLAALKARVAAAIDTNKAKGGLSVGLHPALENLSSWKPSSGSASPSASTPPTGDSSFKAKDSLPQQQHASSVHNRPSPVPRIGDGKSNPYFDESHASQPTGGSGGRGREARQLVFNQKGKYIAQATALRRQAALDAMRQRIAEQTRKAGIDDDTDVEKKFLIEEPPAIEWWDEGIINGSNYDGIDDPGALKIGVDESIITEYIQHPIALEPPQDRQAPAAKPMFLTSKEQAKLRRQRRMADLKEMQAKIRLGLVPAPPPKVKKGNLMRVLGDVAVKDPTAVETRVNREIAERHETHVNSNEDRKLTKEQRQEKLAENQRKDAERGIHVLVFKINSLANGRHRYKVDMGAKQNALTGVCIMHPRLNLVIVEGGEHSVRNFKKLMLQRIDWTENAPSKQREEPGAKQDAVREWLQAENKDGKLKDMSFNECKLIFEGEQNSRSFRKWMSKVCETDAAARDQLTRPKMDSFWSLAKSM